MSHLIIKNTTETEKMFQMMEEDAMFEVSCSSDIIPTQRGLQAAMEHKAPPPKHTPPKLYLCGHCTFNCAYCACRNGRDRESYLVEPRRLAEMASAAAEKSGCGVFLSSAIYKTPDMTQERLAEAVRILREDFGYRGFLHAKVMPGADPKLIAQTGKYASRLSVNIEVAKSEAYAHVAKQKSKAAILTPMGEIAGQIAEHRKAGKYNQAEFAVSQTTQLMAGAAGEDDRTIVTLASALYRKYDLKRVYYTPFTYRYEAKGYEGEPTRMTPFWRVARLYQADRLTQIYNFRADELLEESDPWLSSDIDPKTAWALRNFDLFPVELNTADYDTLIRVPGIGTTWAQRIITARWYAPLSFDTLKQMKISLKRCRYFVTCGGKYLGGTMDPSQIRMQIARPAQLEMWSVENC